MPFCELEVRLVQYSICVLKDRQDCETHVGTETRGVCATRCGKVYCTAHYSSTEVTDLP